jgi:hypothetical protein
MSEPDSYIIDIKDDENTIPTITDNIVTGIKNAEIIGRYRDYESRYTNNPQLWKWDRQQTTSDGDVESGFRKGRRLYDERISDNEILRIVKKMKENKNYNNAQIAGGVLINFINGRNQFGYIIDNYESPAVAWANRTLGTRLGGRKQTKRRQRRTKKTRRTKQNR